MARLVNPDTGTVVEVQGVLEERYRARGWSEYSSADVVDHEPEDEPEVVEADEPTDDPVEPESEPDPAPEPEPEDEPEPVKPKTATRRTVRSKK